MDGEDQNNIYLLWIILLHEGGHSSILKFDMSRHLRPLNSRTTRTMSTRFDLKFFLVFSKYRPPRKLHFTIFQ